MSNIFKLDEFKFDIEEGTYPFTILKVKSDIKETRKGMSDVLVIKIDIFDEAKDEHHIVSDYNIFQNDTANSLFYYFIKSACEALEQTEISTEQLEGLTGTVQVTYRVAEGYTTPFLNLSYWDFETPKSMVSESIQENYLSGNQDSSKGVNRPIDKLSDYAQEGFEITDEDIDF